MSSPIKPAITVSAAHLAMIVRHGAHHGLDIPPLLARLGIDPALLSQLDARVPHAMFAAALDQVSAMLSAPDLGFDLVRDIEEHRPAHLAVLFYVSQTSPTVGAGLANIVRYLRVVHDGGGIRLDTDGADGRIYLQPIVPIYLPRPAQDFMLASMLGRARHLAGVRWSPRVVRFAYEEPADTSRHREIFDAPLEFGSTVTEMLFDRSLLDRVIDSADPVLNALIQQHAAQLVMRLPRLDSPADRVRQAVATMMAQGVPELAAVARHLAMSVRSLQRTLQQEGLSFRELVDGVRRDLALRHVAEQSMALPEIAFLLGFSDASAFHRAFRRWTGTAPGEYRRRAVIAAAPPALRTAETTPTRSTPADRSAPQRRPQER
jgi:AraC-like DNA-binding protein